MARPSSIFGAGDIRIEEIYDASMFANRHSATIQRGAIEEMARRVAMEADRQVMQAAGAYMRTPMYEMKFARQDMGQQCKTMNLPDLSIHKQLQNDVDEWVDGVLT